MKVKRLDIPFPAVVIDNFIPSGAIVRAAAESLEGVNNWVRYNREDNNQVQLCSRLGRENIPPPALLLLDYIATHFDPNVAFDGITSNAFPDMSHYGGGAMITPNSKGEGGYLEMHVDASLHGVNTTWKREYSVILGISENYDSSFDLLLHDGKDRHIAIPYKFNRLWAFKCSENSWHGIDKITEGLDRKTLGVMFWSKITDKNNYNDKKARFDTNLIKKIKEKK